MATNTIDNQIAKTLAYLRSEEGLADWEANKARGYDERACLMAAAMTATGCRKVENIQAIERGVMAAWVRGDGRAA